MSAPWLYGKVEDDVIYVTDINLYHHIKQSFEGKRIQIRIEPLKLTVTEQQYNFYWGVIMGQYCLSEEQFGGWTKDEVDDYLGYHLRSITINVRTHDDQVIPSKRIPSVSTYSRAEMSAYIQQVIVFLMIHHKIIVEQEPYKND